MSREKPHVRAEIGTFTGFSTAVDSSDTPRTLAKIQLNAESHDLGILRSRRGYTVVTFDSTVTSS